MMNGYYDDMGWGGWVLMALIMVAFWALVVFAVMALFRNKSATGPTPGHIEPTPRLILDQRFARGEIDAEEYQARKATLEETAREPH